MPTEVLVNVEASINLALIQDSKVVENPKDSGHEEEPLITATTDREMVIDSSTNSYQGHSRVLDNAEEQEISVPEPVLGIKFLKIMNYDFKFVNFYKISFKFLS